MEPRGFRNNNPGNIEIGKSKWLGKKTPNTDGRFEQFDIMEHGIRAMIILLRNYIKNGRNTITKIITTYAPSNENNTKSYIEKVELLSKIDKDKVLTFDLETIEPIILAMCYVENGRPLPNGVFDGAWDMI